MIDLGIPLLADQGLAFLDEKDRFKHLYCLGKTRTGKSTFFLNLIKQELDNAIIVLDPAGSFAQSVTSLAPPDRLILIDKKHPLVINPLTRKSLEWAELAKEFAEVMNACVMATSSTMESTVLMGEIILNAVRVLDEKQKNIEYLSEFLNFHDVRRQHFKAPDKYWRFFDQKDEKGWYINKEKQDSAKRVAARLSAFYVDPLMKRFTVGANEFDVLEIVREKKIVVVDLHGFDTGSQIYLGNLITHAVKSYYQHQASEQSPPLYVYVDEFHLFMSKFFGGMLSQCAKYNISLNLAHQNHYQITKETLNAIMGNCFVQVVFNCGAEEYEKMAEEFAIPKKEFQQLGKYEAYVRIGNKAHKVLSFPPFKIEKRTEYSFLREGWMSCGTI